MKKIFHLALIICISQQIKAQSTPKYSNSFLDLGVGAKAMGLSNAVVAQTNDAYSGYWNPSGLVHQKDNIQLSFMHSPYMAGIANYDFGSFSTKLDENRAIAASFVRVGVDGIPNTLDLVRNGVIDYSRISTFSSVDYGFLFSYAQKTLKDGLSIGGNAKIIHRKAGQFTRGWGFGFDFSLQYRTASEWNFGLMAKDITSTFNSWRYTFTDAEKDIFTQTGNDIPVNSLEVTLPKFIFGANKYFAINSEYGINTEIDAIFNTDGRRNVLINSKYFNLDPALGIEFDYKKLLFLRAGIGQFQKELDIHNTPTTSLTPTIGLGINLPKFSLDYALTDVGDQAIAPYSHVISIKLAINKKSND